MGDSTVVNRKLFIEHACPICNVEYGFLPEKAGYETTCNYCNTNFTVPVGLPQRMVEVSTDRGRPLTAEETAAFYNSPDGRAYLASQTPSGGVLARRAVDDDDEAIEETRQVVQKRKPKDGPVPVKMRMPGGYGELELPVRQGTADRMATTFLGALIMAIGVVLAAMLGLKKKA